MKAILYARFSPRPLLARCTCGEEFRVEAGYSESIASPCPACGASVQVRNCESCESQLADLRAYCIANGHEIVAEFADKALSGGDDWQDRPGMLDAAAACKRGSTLLVRSYDRLFRDARKALTFVAMLESKGVAVASITEPAANGDDPIAEMVRTIMLAIAAYQRAIIRARTKAKMLQHQAGGRRMSERLPWGWQPDPGNPKRMVPCSEELAIAVQIRNLHGEGLSLRAIGRWLEGHGYQRRGKPNWPHEIIRRILAREVA